MINKSRKPLNFDARDEGCSTKGVQEVTTEDLIASIRGKIQRTLQKNVWKAGLVQKRLGTSKEEAKNIIDRA